MCRNENFANIPASASMTTHDISITENQVDRVPNIARKRIDNQIMALGHSLFTLGLAGIGVLSLGSGDFAYTWQPVPQWIPLRHGLAFISGFALLAAALCMLARRSVRRAALAMTLYQLLLLITLHLTRVLYSPLDVGKWLGLAENLALVCGGWVIVCSVSPSQETQPHKVQHNTGWPRVLFAGACVVFGVSHFAYAEVTAGMVPAWLPYRIGFAYLTGAGHLAAGIAMLLTIIPGIASILEACMISTFIVLLHIPGVLHEPGSRLQWTMLCQASALAGAAWLNAGFLARAKTAVGISPRGGDFATSEN